MPDQDVTDWRLGLEGSTVVPDPRPETASRVRVPGLTILAHPDPRRVGERVALGELLAGRRVALSRLSPDFALPGQRSALGPRPLADPQMSRQPMWLEIASPGTVRLVPTPGTPRPTLFLEGEGLEAPLEVSSEALEDGVVLRLARVALLLHQVDPTPVAAGRRFGMVGASAALVELRRALERVANLDVPVLVRGETGSGKELVARALHAASRRSEGPLVCVNMASIPPELAAAELFGAVKGAFTGADRSRRGFFRRADGGTLFLDEIGETPSDVQPMLLRTLETGEVQPVGAGRPLGVDVRVVAATDADLDGGRFRAPLLHRLSGSILRVPPLRRRRDDVGRLLLHFLRSELEACGELRRLDPAGGRGRPWLPASLVARLARQPWPGNVRQLRNVARHLVVTYRAEPEITAAALASDRQLDELLGEGAGEQERTARRGPRDEPSPGPRLRRRQPSQVSPAELLAALRAHRWRLQPTAKALGISRTSLYALVDKCPDVRRASDLDADEITSALEASSGDSAAAADALEVSEHGLLQRMRELDIP